MLHISFCGYPAGARYCRMIRVTEYKHLPVGKGFRKAELGMDLKPLAAISDSPCCPCCWSLLLAFKSLPLHEDEV